MVMALNRQRGAFRIKQRALQMRPVPGLSGREGPKAGEGTLGWLVVQQDVGCDGGGGGGSRTPGCSPDPGRPARRRSRCAARPLRSESSPACGPRGSPVTRALVAVGQQPAEEHALREESTYGEQALRLRQPSWWRLTGVPLAGLDQANSIMPTVLPAQPAFCAHLRALTAWFDVSPWQLQ